MFFWSIYTVILLYTSIVSARFDELRVEQRNLEIFVPFGTDNGDSVMMKNDDDYIGPINITAKFTFFHINYSSVYVNTNGLLTFGSHFTSFSVVSFPSKDFSGLSVFWNDINTNKGGDIFYRKIMVQATLDAIANEIKTAFLDYLDFQPSFAFVATWYEVAAYSGSQGLKNTFQAVITTNGKHSFVIFNYDKLEWSKSENNNNHAVVGYNAGDGVVSYMVRGSWSNHILTLTNSSNVGVPGKFIFEVTGENTIFKNFVPFGAENGDLAMEKNENKISGPINMNEEFLFFQRNYSTVYLSSNGLLTFGSSFSESRPSPLPSRYFSGLSVFWNDIDINKSGDVFYRLITKQTTLDVIANNINSAFLDQWNFQPTFAFVATWYEVAASSGNQGRKNTFQAVITTDGKHSFAIFNYHEIGWSASANIGTKALVGYNAGDGVVSHTVTGDIFTLTSRSNVGVPGKFIFKVGSQEKVLKNFVPFGFANSDSVMEKNYNNYIGPIYTSSNIPFFHRMFSTLYVSTDGLVTFGSGFSRYSSFVSNSFPSQDFSGLSIFWSYIDTTKGGDIFYRLITEQTTLDVIANEIKSAFFDHSNFQPSFAFVATWYEVAAFSGNQGLKNTFQTVIITNGEHSFAIFNYDKLEWSNSDNINKHALVGYNAGDGVVSHTVDGSNSSEIKTLTEKSNVGVPGKFIFEIGSGGCNHACCNTMELFPTTFVPFGTKYGDVVMRAFDGNSDVFTIAAKFPFLNRVFSTIYVNTNGLVTFGSSYSGYYPELFPSRDFSGLSVFWSRIDNTKSCQIFYRQVNDTKSLDTIAGDIRRAFSNRTNFTPSFAFVVTWYEVAANSGNAGLKNTFQAVITTDGKHSFAIFNYDKLEWSSSSTSQHAIVGYNAGNGGVSFAVEGSNSSEILTITNRTNVGVPGKFIFDVTGEEIVLKNFVPFGLSNGDSMIDQNDNGVIGPIEIAEGFPFFQRNYSTVYLSSHGLFTFGSSYTSYSPYSFPTSGFSGVAVFWNAISATKSGGIFYRKITEQTTLNSIATEINSAFSNHKDFRPSFTFVATWYEVAASSGSQGLKNTFQAVITTDSKHSFVIFNYDKLEWSISQYSSYHALVGYNAGDGKVSYTVRGSLSNHILTLTNSSNVGVPGKFIFEVTGEDTIFKNFVPFGPENGDLAMIKNENKITGPINLSEKFLFFQRNYSTVYLSSNGLLTFGSSFSESRPSPLPSREFSGLSVFWNDIDINKSGDVFYRQITKQTTLDVIANNINSAFLDHWNFQPTFAFVATWYEVAASSGNQGRKNTFQAVITTDGEHSFAIFNYHEIGWSTSANIGTNALVGYNAGDGVVSHTVTGDIFTLTSRSNVRVPGKFIFKVGSQEKVLKNFVAFGFANSDSVMEKNYNNYIGPIYTSSNIPFFHRMFSTFYVSTNGLVTFGSGYSSNFPDSFPTQKFSGLSVFWNDIDTRKGGDIFYRLITEKTTLDVIAGEIRRAFSDYSNFEPTFAFVATWLEVAAYSGNVGLKNTFQAVIITDGEHSFAIFNYDKLEWSISKFSFLHALVGYNAGDGVVSHTVDGSNSSEIKTLTEKSNVGVPGKFIFEIGSGGCNHACCNTMKLFPTTFVPFGTKYGDVFMQNILYGNGDVFNITTKFPFFNRVFSKIYISTNGLVTFGSPYSSYVPKPFPSRDFSGLSVFWSYIDNTKSCQIFYRQVKDKKLLDAIAGDIRRAYSNHTKFTPSFAFVVTWYEVAANSGNAGLKNTFQAVITTDGKHSFAIFNYDKLEWSISQFSSSHALVGYNAGDGKVSFTVEGSNSSEILTITNRTNVGVPGKFIFDVTGEEIVLKNFVPFGLSNGDSMIDQNDNGVIGPIEIAEGFPFFQRNYSTVYLSSHGLFTFGSSYTSYSPNSFPTSDFSGVAVFWNAISATKSGGIFYRKITEQTTLNSIATEINSAFSNHKDFRPSFTFVATWYNVADIFGNVGLKNTFQAVITTDGKHSFAIFNYDKLEWSISQFSSSHALVGYNAGDGKVSFTVEGSNSSEILTITNRTNVGVPGKFIFDVTGEEIVLKNFVPFGSENGDLAMIKNENKITGPINLSEKFLFFQRNYSTVYLSSNGLLTFGSSLSESRPSPLPSREFSGLSVFWNDIDINKSGDVFYRQITKQTTLDVIANNINSAFLDHWNFQPTFAFVATWYEVAASSGNQGRKNTFQAVITTDGEHSFAIFNYHEIGWSTSANIGTNALVGYNAGDGVVSHTVTGDILTLTSRSNVGMPGKFIFKVGSQEKVLKNFVAFGFANSDSVMEKNYNNYIGPIYTSSNIPFFHRMFSTFYVSTNGLVTFGSGYSSDVPDSFPTQKFSGLSVFWNDIDTRKGGDIFYRLITEKTTLDVIASEIRRAFSDHSNFRPSFAFVATWHEVAAYSGNVGLKNTFQAVIITNGEHSFAIFNYDKLEWSKSDNNNNHAVVGYNAGDGGVSYTIDGLGTSQIRTLTNRTNVNVPGKFIFKVSGQEIVVKNFVPFGWMKKDSFFQESFYYTLSVDISVRFPFFQRYYSTIFISTNGLITFNEPVNQYRPQAFHLFQFSGLSVFWNRIATYNGGGIFYRQINDPKTLEMVAKDIKIAFLHYFYFQPSFAFVVTWYQVASYSGNENLRNTFQVVIATDGNLSFAIFNYDKLEWSRSTNVEDHALVGFNADDGNVSCTIDGSMTSEIRSLPSRSNMRVPGKFIFRIDKDEGRCNNGFVATKDIRLLIIAFLSSILVIRNFQIV